VILYWFGPRESKTLRLVLRFVLLRSQVGLHGRGVDVEVVYGLSPGGRPCPPYIGRRTRSVDQSPSQLQHGNLSLVCLHHERLIRAALIHLDFLILHAKLSSRLRTHMSGRVGLLTGRRVFC
jgi:hypothetical protein